MGKHLIGRSYLNEFSSPLAVQKLSSDLLPTSFEQLGYVPHSDFGVPEGGLEDGGRSDSRERGVFLGTRRTRNASSERMYFRRHNAYRLITTSAQLMISVESTFG